MKKIDKLILSSFLGPFILTLVVVVFILLNIQMLKYFDDIIGKDLGWGVLATLVFYFAIFTIPTAMPLAVLLSSLITFGNLGEHFELTAVKSLGISLVRSLAPIFIFVLLLTGIAFYANNYLVPKAALEAYSLLYDIKQKKPALDLREGVFYNSIPDLSIKVNDRLPDGKTIRGVIIYDHRGRTGNKEVTIADSGKMSTFLNDQYLKMELFNGYRYSEGGGSGTDLSGRSSTGETGSKTKFERSQIVFDLSSFGLNRTDKKWFQGNRIMRNTSELEVDMDSIRGEMLNQDLSAYTLSKHLFNYHFKKDTIEMPNELKRYQRKKDSIRRLNPAFAMPNAETSSNLSAHVYTTIDDRIKTRSDSIFKVAPSKAEIGIALGNARMIKSQLLNLNSSHKEREADYKVYQIQWHKIFSNSIACIVMFLIGAPLGAIIKRGGLGVPVLASIFFFIVFYLLTMLGEKWARNDLITVPMGIWFADSVLFIIGLVFLRQARVDARLFEADFYSVLLDKFKIWLIKRKLLRPMPV